FMHGLDAAASYLGLTEAQLRTRLESGKSLADVAKAQDKSLSGLKDAMLADAKTKLAAAVKAGRLTSAEEQRILSGLEQHLDDLINVMLPDHRFVFPVGPPGSAFRDGAGPPPSSAPAA